MTFSYGKKSSDSGQSLYTQIRTLLSLSEKDLDTWTWRTPVSRKTIELWERLSNALSGFNSWSISFLCPDRKFRDGELWSGKRMCFNNNERNVYALKDERNFHLIYRFCCRCCFGYQKLVFLCFKTRDRICKCLRSLHWPVWFCDGLGRSPTSNLHLFSMLEKNTCFLYFKRHNNTIYLDYVRFIKMFYNMCLLLFTR